MKKLLVLGLVLGLASVASAALSFDITGAVDVPQGDVLTISIQSDNTQGWVGYAIVEEGGDGAVSGIVRLNPSPTDNSSAGWYTEAGWGAGYEITTADTAGALVTGAQWTIDWDTSALSIGDSAVISLWDDAVGYSAPVSAITATVVPEPMTIALLGLGGLFLRRRK